MIVEEKIIEAKLIMKTIPLANDGGAIVKPSYVLYKGKDGEFKTVHKEDFF